MTHSLVIIESPYAGNIECNVAYARACMVDSLERGETPFASHLIYTQPGILDDGIPDERMRGIEGGYEWGKHADLIAYYVDFGVSPGMLESRIHWESTGIPIETRRVERWTYAPE